MIVLHAGSCEGQILLWAEMSPEKSARPTGPRSRSAKPQPAHRYGCDGGRVGLARALEACATIRPKAARFREVMIWLPTSNQGNGQAISSSPLIAEAPASSDTPALAPWIIEALALSNGEAVELLCACMGKRTLAAGIVVGDDLAYWADALRFAGATVARQQYLPHLAMENKRCRAQWEPHLAGKDTERFARLANQMPPVARALSDVGGVAPPDTSASIILRQFVALAVDHLVRSSCAGESAGGVGQRTVGSGRKKKIGFASAHDAWLCALRSGDGIVEGAADSVAHLSEQVAQWQRPIAVAAASPFRLCFRLEEPPKEPASELSQERPEPWRVRYLLQAHDDPSLIVPVAAAWETRNRTAAALMSFGSNAREYILASLGQAAGLCSRIASSLKTAKPSGHAMDATGAYEFLTEKAGALAQAGFGVMLPAWWTGRGTQARLALRAMVKSPKMQSQTGLSLNTIVQFDWQVALGDASLTRQELEALADAKAPLVRLRGQWIEVKPDDLQAAVDLWDKQAGGDATLREVVGMALGAKPAPGGLVSEGVVASGWIAELLDQLQERRGFEELPAPENFQARLRPYQTRGYSWLNFLRQWGLGACLADDMGLGKTIEALALIRRDWPGDGGNGRPVLVICPTSVAGNWQKEAARFTPDLPVMVHHGLARTRDESFRDEAGRHAIVISTYALLHRDLEILKEVEWAGIILDEAQNIKNPETKQSKAARTLKAGWRAVLTGTPVENHVGDLWSIMEFLNPGFLGTQAEFKRNFFVPIQAGHDPTAADRLKRLTAPFILRRLKTDKNVIADLPEKMEMKVFCTLTREQASLYEAVVKDVEEPLESSEGIQRKGLILATLMKLKQVCNHPAQFLKDNSAVAGRSGKLARLTEMLEETFEVGDRALVFTQFAEMGAMLQGHLQETFGREVPFLHGGAPKRRRDEMVERFQTAGDGPGVFILSLKAGGTGLNLTRANHVFHFDRWWNPAVENQATDRVFRIGQTRDVQVHKFLCVGTLEEKIDEMIERKKDVAERVVGTGEGWLTELSSAELKNLLELRKEAIAQ